MLPHIIQIIIREEKNRFNGNKQSRNYSSSSSVLTLLTSSILVMTAVKSYTGTSDVVLRVINKSLHPTDGSFIAQLIIYLDHYQ